VTLSASGVDCEAATPVVSGSLPRSRSSGIVRGSVFGDDCSIGGGEGTTAAGAITDGWLSGSGIGRDTKTAAVTVPHANAPRIIKIVRMGVIRFRHTFVLHSTSGGITGSENDRRRTHI
jgi:hypothetical protein